MTDTTGFFALRGPADLLEKLRHDYRRLEAAPADTYAAFDFFVAAVHMHEWLDNSGVPWTKPTDPHTLAAFELCGAVGNGAKHCVMEDRVPGGHEVTPAVFDPAAFDPHLFDVGGLVLHLNAREAALFGTKSVTALWLAAYVLDYWETYTQVHVKGI